MANRFPLIFNSTANQIQELAGSDNLDLTSCGISSVNNVYSAGIVTATGGFNLGISSAGTSITSGPLKTLNFVGAGHTFVVSGTTIDISISGGGGGGGGGSGQFNTGISSAIGYPVTTSMATAYTATDAVVIHSVHITNIDGTSSADISGQMYAGGYSIAHTVPVPAGSSVEMLKQPKVLNTGETLQLESSATGDLHATISLEPQTGSSAFIGVGTDITAATTYTDLYTAAADTVLQGILLANDDGANDVKATVVWTDSGNTIVGYFAYEMVIPADATVEILEQPKFLPSGYKVRVQGNEADRLEAILSAKTA
tara:strand:- start:386 stop:1324 length:939 start_codon:yes stop_codon:yes gene_type:complete